MTVGARLSEERKRLRLSQGDFAHKAGVSISTQKRYETNEREPGTGYLEGIRELGVDITYVLTGMRRGGLGGGVSSDHLAEFGLAAIKFLSISPANVSAIAIEAEKATKAALYGREESPDFQEEGNRYLEAFEEYFFVHASTLFRQRIDELSPQGMGLDPVLLAASIEQIDRATDRAGKTFPPAKKAHLIAMAYKLARRTGNMDAGIADDVVSIA